MKDEGNNNKKKKGERNYKGNEMANKTSKEGFSFTVMAGPYLYSN